MIAVRPAEPRDLDTVHRLLEENDLPIPGVEEHFGDFLVAEENGVVVGAIGMEQYGETGLLRSAVVHPSCRNRGVGGMLVDRLLERSRTRSLRRLVLLTTTAGEYFGRKGFQRVDRSGITGPVAESVEFTEACPSTATCMELML